MLLLPPSIGKYSVQLPAPKCGNVFPGQIRSLWPNDLFFKRLAKMKIRCCSK